MPEPSSSIRVLNRGLEVLVALNRLERAAINTLANAVRLPRTTTFRILETLRLAGYVDRDAHDDCYRPTLQVRALSARFDDEYRIGYLAKPLLMALSRHLVWPVAIATPSGGTMTIRESTDSVDLALERDSVGTRQPMLSTAAGRVYLANCTAPERDALLEFMSRSSPSEDRLARNRAEIDRVLNETRVQGFGMMQQNYRALEEASLAVSIRVQERVMAAVTVRYAARTLPLRAALEQLLPKMREVARQIETQFV